MAARQRRLDHTLRDVGRKGELVSRCRETLYSLGRVLGFFALAAQQRKDDKGLRARIRTASRDVASLSDQVAFLSSKITFLLDATLGMISIQQAGIIKIFSVAAVVFLPPTLIASIYGMNFEFMPELQWAYGYPAAIALMVAAAIMPYLYFKHRGWL
jgi:magnesium transporter